MTPREYCLARVLTDREVRGLIVVLKHCKPNEDFHREAWAAKLGGNFTRPNGSNTRQEAENILHREWATSDLTIVTSSYHQLRAFLTFVAVFRDTNTRIWNAPAPSSMDLLAEEFKKIELYQARGHVASYDEGIAYLERRASA